MKKCVFALALLVFGFVSASCSELEKRPGAEPKQAEIEKKVKERDPLLASAKDDAWSRLLNADPKTKAYFLAKSDLWRVFSLSAENEAQRELLKPQGKARDEKIVLLVFRSIAAEKERLPFASEIETALQKSEGSAESKKMRLLVPSCLQLMESFDMLEAHKEAGYLKARYQLLRDVIKDAQIVADKIIREKTPADDHGAKLGRLVLEVSELQEKGIAAARAAGEKEEPTVVILGPAIDAETIRN